MNKQNKGITLVALVITIVVLVILVGVSVSVSINTGLIEKSKMVVADYDKAQKDEEILLTDMEVSMDFIRKETPYKFKNGYLTGVKFNNGMTEKVEELELRLPEGYTVHSSDNEDIDEKDKTNVITGMVLRKNGVKVGNIVVFGDINKDASILSDDASAVMSFIYGITNYNDYNIIAMDVNHDSIIDNQDYDHIMGQVTGTKTINQLVEVKNNVENMTIKSQRSYIDNYINELPETFTAKYNVYYNEEYGCYEIKINPGTVTAATFLSDLQDPDARLDIYDESDETYIEGVTDETPITAETILYSKWDGFGMVEVIYIVN